ncbi:MAG: cytochrome P450, partial [Actinomycetota bacterium]|nr:cytochrome P450 [Actinomycetota bacterium]
MIDPAQGYGGSDFIDGTASRHLIGDAQLTEGLSVSSATAANGCPAWVVTGYRETRDFLRDSRFSRTEATDRRHPPGPALRMSVTEMDPPRHTGIRTLIGGAFSARNVEPLRPAVERAAGDLLDELMDAGPSADLLADFCAPLAFAAQCELLGVPQRHRESIRAHAVERLGCSDAAATREVELRLHAEVTTMLADDQPRTGLFAELAEAHRRGEIDATDLTGLATSLFFDGHALSAAQIAHTVLCL